MPLIIPLCSPRIPGHEVVGDIVKLGEGVDKWSEGDRVGGPWHGGHDGTCKQCNRGNFQMCSNEAINGISRDGGCKFDSKLTLCRVEVRYLVY